MKIPFKVICLRDEDKPDGIPTSKWVKKGQPYTVIQVDKLRMQGGMLGFKLEELNIDSYFPYQYFAASRFGVPVDQETQEYLEKLLIEIKKEVEEKRVEVLEAV